jgi:iron complex transport system substrate-binding protein
MERDTVTKGQLDRARRDVQLFFLLCAFVSLCLCDGFSEASAEPPQRIVSLAPSITEIIYATGIEERLVGVTTFCDYPDAAQDKPKIGGMSNPSLEAVLSLKPDIVLMTTDGNPKEFQAKLHSLGMKSYVVEALTLPELPEGIRKMGRVLGEVQKFELLAADIEMRITRLRNNRGMSRKRVLFIIWPEPLIVAGADTAVDDAIEILGSTNIASEAQGRYPKYSLEEIYRQSPDVIFFGKGKGMSEVSQGLLSRIAAVPAVKEGQVYYVSDKLFRLGPRAIEGVEELAGYLNR